MVVQGYVMSQTLSVAVFDKLIAPDLSLAKGCRAGGEKDPG
jgi:hypothetical protein